MPPRTSCRAGAAPPPRLTPHWFLFPLLFHAFIFISGFFFFSFFSPSTLAAISTALPCSPLGPFTSSPLLPSLSSLPFSLQLEAAPHPFIPAHPSAPSRCLALGKARPYWRGHSPTPSAHLQSCPKFGGPLVMARGVPSLFAAPCTAPHLWNGALGNAGSSSGSPGHPFAPHRGVLQVFRDIPPWARIPAAADAARSPSGRANKALSSRVPASSPLFVEVSLPSLYGPSPPPPQDPHSAPGGG